MLRDRLKLIRLIDKNKKFKKLTQKIWMIISTSKIIGKFIDSVEHSILIVNWFIVSKKRYLTNKPFNKGIKVGNYKNNKGWDERMGIWVQIPFLFNRGLIKIS